MKNFGILVGMAFQIKDDVFDYASPGKIGKPTGIDIREQKMTLPLIYTINNSDSSVCNELKNIIKNKNQSSKHIKRAVQLVSENGGLEYAYEKMKSMISEAFILLDVFPESEAKKSLIGLLDYTIKREK
jgi:octaprenyl-diphosphate synthase